MVLNRGVHERGDCDFLLERPDVSKNKDVFLVFHAKFIGVRKHKKMHPQQKISVFFDAVDCVF